MGHIDSIVWFLVGGSRPWELGLLVSDQIGNQPTIWADEISPFRGIS